jgi:hypothetical protein
MTIPTPYLWPLGCLTALGAIHAAFWLDDFLHHFANVSIDAWQRWRARR